MSYMASASSALRVSGGISGIDTDSVVKQLMEAQRAPLDKLNQNKQRVEWTRESYREISSKVVDFRQNKISSTYNLSEALNVNKAVVSGNTTAVTATATSAATGIAMKVTVEHLATKASLTGGSLTKSDGTKVTSSTTLSQLTGGSETGNYTIKINGTDVALTGKDTISSVISKINSKSEAKASATFDEIKGQLSITSKEYGGALTVDNTAGNAFASLLGLDGKTVVAAKKAEATINGTKLTFDTNVNTINGVKLNFLATSASATDFTTITNQSDATKVVDTIKAFVSSYNDLLNSMKTKVEETRYKDYAPLTTEQKKALSEEDAEAWTKKAKSGMLRGDEILKSAIQDMRAVITTGFSGKSGGTPLADLGITTGIYTEGGKLYLDEAKLTAAVEANPQGVIAAFQGTSTDRTKGVFNQLYDKLSGTLTKMYDKAGTSKTSTDLTAAFTTKSSMYKELTNFDKRISAMTTRLNQMETRYYTQFSAMESSLSKLNSQSSSLAGFFSS